MISCNVKLKLGLRGRLLLLVISLVSSVVFVLSTYIVYRQIDEINLLMDSKIEVMRKSLSAKGMSLARNAALSAQRSVAVLEYLFLFEIIKTMVEHDAEVKYGIIMDTQRRAMVHSMRSLQNQILDGPTDHVAAKTTIVTVQDAIFDGQPVLEAIAPIMVGDERWGMIRLGLSLQSLNEEISQNRRMVRDKIVHHVTITLIATVVVLMIGSAIGATGAKQMVLDPIEALIRGVQRVGDSALDQPIRLQSSPEFMALATALNDMSSTIQKRNADLKQLNSDLLIEIEQRKDTERQLQQAHDKLEERVIERTIQLSKTNEELAAEVNKRRLAEESIAKYAARLEASNQELESFAYVASHDLQEPLRKIQAFGDRLRTKCSDSLGEQELDYLNRMIHASTRMRSLINDLLNFSRVTTKAKPLVPTALTELVNEVLSDLEIAISSKNAIVQVQDLPTINADPTQMRQLFQNLIGNALKFQAPGRQPLIQVTAQKIMPPPDGARAKPTEDQLYQINVKDNGIGFDEKYSEKIFRVFQRLHSRSEYEGTGMGLAICRKIAERHGGTLIARSKLGEGSVFIITVPEHHTLGAEGDADA